MNNSKKLTKLVGVSTLLVVSVIVSGCNQSIARRDSISPNFGNAMAANTALQTVDPWPRYVENTHIHTDGAKTGNAIENYQNPSSSSSSTSSTSLVESSDVSPKI